MDDEQQARLARLAVRGRATASPPHQRHDATTTALTAMAEPTDPSPLLPQPRPVDRASARPGGQPPSTEPARRGRRRHTAVAGRILVAGVATSAFIGGLAALAAAPPPAWEQNAAAKGTATGQPAADAKPADAKPADTAPAEAPLPPVQDTIYVVQIVPHRVYVDEDGNPTDPNAPGADSPAGDDPDAAASEPAATPRAAAAPQSPPAVAAPGEPKATAPAPTPAPTAAPRPTSPPATKPACAGSKCA